MIRMSSWLFCVLPSDKYDVPWYRQVTWDIMDILNLTTLGEILSSKRHRVRCILVVLKGTRMIRKAISHRFSSSLVDHVQLREVVFAT